MKQKIKTNFIDVKDFFFSFYFYYFGEQKTIIKIVANRV